MFKLHVCKICGDPYLGDEAPSKCPFCGAPKGFFIEGEKFDDPFAREHGFTDTEKMDFQKALELEMGNASFYKKASETSSDLYHKKLFKALFKVESEHASIFSKHLGMQKPDIDETIEASSDGHENLMTSHKREEIAIKSYKEFLTQASTPRAKEVFGALVTIESDHLSLED